MKVLVIGSGGREHAIAWRLAQSPSVDKVYAAPGNPGIEQVAECLPGQDYLQLAETYGIDLTVVGPEAPLVAGVVDAFRAAGRLIVGPTKSAAELEGSKIFAKNFMERHGIPTARYVSVDNIEEGRKALDEFGCPVVLKADGLAAGKGVVIARNRAEAEANLHAILSGQLVGSAGAKLVIEEFLVGEEVSFIVLSDGERALSLEPTQDHKAVYDGDTGPNTGGMGAYCDARILTEEQRHEVLAQVIQPTIDGMRAEGNPFTGFLYAGLIMTDAGVKVLEYNVRLGDPETQALMHRVDSDFGTALLAAAQGDLSNARLDWKPEPSVCVVMTAAGYPATPRKGDLIAGLAEAEATGATVFHAGTRRTDRGIETAGGRVLGVTARGEDLAKAIAGSYDAVRHIDFAGAHYRNDIGRKGLKRW